MQDGIAVGQTAISPDTDCCPLQPAPTTILTGQHSLTFQFSVDVQAPCLISVVLVSRILYSQHTSTLHWAADPPNKRLSTLRI